LPLKVIRDRPTDRNRFSGLSGSLMFKVRVLSPVHIGSGGPSIEGLEELASKMKEREIGPEELKSGEEIFDAIRISGKPAIPGSSLKGAVRSRLELSFKGKNGSVPSCFSVTGMVEKPSWRHMEIYESSREDRGPPCDYLRYGTVCKVCDIFGAPGLASRVHFPSLFFERTELMETEAGKLAVIPEGLESTGKLLFHGMEPYEMGLVLVGTGNGKPLLIGAMKYRSEMGRILITPISWSFMKYSKGILEELGVDKKEDGTLTVDSDSLNLWNKLVEEARRRYKDYLVEEDFDARAKKIGY